MKGLFGITNKPAQSSLKDLQKILIEKTLSQTVIQMSKSLCWLKLFSVSWVTLYQGSILDYKQIKKYDSREKPILQKISKTKQPRNIQAFSQIQERFRQAIEYSKKKYYKKLSNKLSNDKLNGKCYWTILKRFLTVKNSLHTPPPRPCFMRINLLLISK